MPIKIHDRVTVRKPGPDTGKCGSVTWVDTAAGTVGVVLEDGRARNEGGVPQPAEPTTFLATELG